MRIQSITPLNTYHQSVFKSNKDSSNTDNYVKIPKKKYQRDKILLGIATGWITFDIIRFIIDTFGKGGKPPFP